MQSATRSKKVLELGKRLVIKLGLADDLLGQWIAHDLAARIDALESNPEQATTAMRDECVKTILALWEHRNMLPAHLRPFHEIEPITRTLAALDVERGDDYRYFRPTLREAALEGVDEPSSNWLDLAFGLDYSARVLIQHALQSAGAAAGIEAHPWVEAAIRAGAEVEPERQTIDFLLGRLYPDGNLKNEKIEEAKKEALCDKISKLEHFAALANTLATELRERLDNEFPPQAKP
ncbi:hypothetical protein [Pseudomonas shirazensis]|uniref:hypothetical protein n=1 Tax=Pseudomonas shirazensis TaxID=2745494 RepID=UPI003987DE9E